MKYRAENYAESLSRALTKHPNKSDVLTKNFARLLKKNGDLNLFPKIVENLRVILIKKRGGHRVKIEFAREPEKDQLKRITSVFNSEDVIETYLNPELVAGTRITIDGERELDNSLSRKLHKLFC